MLVTKDLEHYETLFVPLKFSNSEMMRDLKTQVKKVFDLPKGSKFELWTLKKPKKFNFLDPKIEKKIKKGNELKIVITFLNIDTVKEHKMTVQKKGWKDPSLLDRVESFKCHNDKCRKSFNKIQNLFRHMRLHFSERPYQCLFPGCSKGFLLQSHLTQHEKIHSNSSILQCPYLGCEKTFNRQLRLDVHMLTHQGVKPFVCPYDDCTKSFFEKGSLKTHVRKHLGITPFKCSQEGCEELFISQSYLNAHLSSVHHIKQKNEANLNPTTLPRTENLFSQFFREEEPFEQPEKDSQKEQVEEKLEVIDPLNLDEKDSQPELKLKPLFLADLNIFKEIQDEEVLGAQEKETTQSQTGTPRKHCFYATRNFSEAIEMNQDFQYQMPEQISYTDQYFMNSPDYSKPAQIYTMEPFQTFPQPYVQLIPQYQTYPVPYVQPMETFWTFS